MELNEIDLVDLAGQLQRREATATAATQACLDRITAREDAVHAWTFLDPEAALAAAKSLDEGPVRGPLHGVPVAIKDIFDTADMPTAYGSPIYKGHRPAADAATVAMLREAGAVVLGKTVTTEFAYFQPGPTANPHNAGHTPGGSSSGSAAAIADRMVPLAFGSQTAASVTRPAAYCGTIGFKSTWGRFSLAGIKPLAQSLDSLGWMTRTVADAAYVYDVLVTRAAPEAGLGDGPAPRIALCRTPQWDAAEPSMQAAFDAAGARLAAAGAMVEELVLPDAFGALVEDQKTVMGYEAVRALAWERTQRRALMSEAILTLLDGGVEITFDDYLAALDRAEACRQALRGLMAGWDAILAPAAPGEAPAGLGATGDPIFSRMWTLLGIPSICLPAGRGSDGLPLGVQLLGRATDERALFDVGHWAQSALG